jgi:VWFA-related protein
MLQAALDERNSRMTELTSPASCFQSGTKLLNALLFSEKEWVKAAFKFLCRSLLLTLIALPVLVLGQNSPPLPSRNQNPYVINVSVNMVVLHATVQNQKNLLVSGLDKENFQVYENGMLQQITYFSHDDIPVTVGLVVDNSGSMGPKRSDVIAAALAFARASNPSDQIFVVNFNEKVSFALPGGTPFTDNAVQLEVALSRIVASGETALYDAIDAALVHLKGSGRDKKVLIVISDGGDNASKHKLEQVIALARQSSVIIYSIGIFEEQDEDRNPTVLRRFAEETGGEAYFPESAKEVISICERIAHDIRSQYTLAYVPTNKNQDGRYRVIRVNAGMPGRTRLSVRTRPGYFAPLEPTSPAEKAVSHEPH